MKSWELRSASKTFMIAGKMEAARPFLSLPTHQSLSKTVCLHWQAQVSLMPIS